MTKEEIISNALEDWQCGASLEKCLNKAMTEYAKQTSIGFAEWIKNNNINWNYAKNQWDWAGAMNIHSHTTDQLYTVFEKSLKK